MKQKTAIQIAIEKFTTVATNQEINENSRGIWALAVNELTKLLPTERDQIQYSYYDGVIDGLAQDTKAKETYFTDNYQE